MNITSKKCAVLSAALAVMLGAVAIAHTDVRPESGNIINTVQKDPCADVSEDHEPATDDNGNYVPGGSFGNQAAVDLWIACILDPAAPPSPALGWITETSSGTGGGGVGANGVWDRLLFILGDDLITKPSAFLGTKWLKATDVGDLPAQYSRTNITRKAEIAVSGIPEGLLSDMSAGGRRKGVLLEVTFEGVSQPLYSMAFVATPSSRRLGGRTVSGVNSFAARNFAQGSNFALIDSVGNAHKFVSASSLAGGGSFLSDSTAIVANVILRQYNVQ